MKRHFKFLVLLTTLVCLVIGSSITAFASIDVHNDVKFDTKSHVAEFTYDNGLFSSGNSIFKNEMSSDIFGNMLLGEYKYWNFNTSLETKDSKTKVGIIRKNPDGTFVPVTAKKVKNKEYSYDDDGNRIDLGEVEMNSYNWSKSYGTLDEAVEKAYIGNTLILNFSGFDFSFSGTAKEFAEKSVIYIIDSNKKSISETSMYDFLKSLQSETSSDLAKLSAKVTNKDNTSYTLETFFDNKSAVSSKKSNEYIQKIFMGYADSIESANIDLVYDNDEIKSPKINFTASNSGKLRVSIITNRRHLVGFLDLSSGFIDDDFTDEPNVKYDIVYPNLTVSNMPTEPQHTFFTVQLNTDIPCVLTDVATGDIIGYTSNGAVDYSVDWGNGTYTINCFPLKDEEKVDENGHGIYYEGRDNSFEVTCFADDFKRPDTDDDDKTYDSDPKAVDEDPEDEENGGEVSVDDIDVTTLGTDKVTTLAQTGMSPNKLILVIAGVFLVVGIILSRKNFKKFISSILVLALFIGSFSAVNIVDVKAENTGTGGFSAGGNGAQYASPGDFCFHIDSPGDVVYKIYAVNVKEYQDKLFTNEGGWNNKTISNDLQYAYNLRGIRLVADSGLNDTTYTDFYTLADNSTGKDVVCLAKDREDNNKNRGVTFFNNVIADVCNPNRANILSISDANERAQAQAQVQAIRDEISKLGDVNNIISDNAFTLKNNDTSKVAGVLSILSASKYYKTPERIKGLYQQFLGDVNVAKISDWSTVQLVAEVGVAAHVSKNYYVISSTTMERTDDAEIWGDPISVANSNKGLVTNIAKLKDTYWYKGTSDGTQYLRGIASKFVQSTYVRTDGSTTTIDGNIGQNHRGVIFFFTTKRGITKKRYDYSVLARANISDGVSTLDSQQTLKHDTRLMRRELIVEKTMQNDGTYKEELKEDKTKYQLWNVNNWQDISADDANGFKAVSTLNDGYSLYMKDGTITTKNGYNATSLTTKNTSEGVLKDALDMPSQNYYYKASPINNSDLNKGKTYSLRIDGDYASGITTKASKSGGSAAHRKKSETMSLFNNGVFPYEDNSPTKNGYKETSIAKKYNNYLDKFNLVNGNAYTVHEVDVNSPDDFSAGCVIPVLEFIETKEPTVTTNCYKINVGYANDNKDSIVYKGTLKFNNMTKTYKISDTAGYLSPTATQYVVAVPSGTQLNIPSESTKFDTLQSLGNSLTSSSEALSTIAVPNESVTVGATISENKWVGYDIYFIVTDEGSNGTNAEVEKNVQLDEYRINKVYNQLAKSNLIRTSYYSQRELGTKLYNVVADNNKNLTKYNAMLFDKVIDSSSPIISNGLLKTKWVGNLGSANSLKRIKDGDSSLSYVYTKDRASYTGVTSFGLKYNSYTSEYVKIPVLRSLSLELTRAISNDTVVLSSLAIGNASSVINKIMESASKYGVTKDLKASGFNVKGTYSYNPSGASAKNDSAERIIGTHTASTAYKGTYKNNNNDGYSPDYNGRRYKWGTDNYVESVTDNKSNAGLKSESSYANNLINVGPLRFKSATLNINSKTFKYSPHKRDAGKVTEKILLPEQTLNDKNNNPVTVFAESKQVGLNLYFFPEVNMSITMYSNGKYKTITDIPTIGQARRTVDRGLLFGRTDSYAQNKAVGKSSADMSATDGAVYRGSDITLVVTDTGFKRTYFGYVLDIIDQNDKDYNKLTNLGKTDTSSLAVQWGNKKLSDRDAEIKDKFNNEIKNDSIKPIIKLDLTINGKKYENFDVSQSGSSFKAEETKIDKSFPISVKKGAIVKNSGYTDLINSIREDYLCSYDEAESLFNNSGMINAILNSMETISSADNTSIVRSDGKHWYDEYTRTFVVRRLINDSFSLGTVTSQDKIDMNANTSKTEGSGINNIIKGSNVNATWNLSFYTKENDTEKLILTKPIDGANFKVSYLTTEDLQ